MATFLIVEARFYDNFNDMLIAGARAALEQAGHSVEVLTVPGALEIPGAIALAAGLRVVEQLRHHLVGATEVDQVERGKIEAGRGMRRGGDHFEDASPDQDAGGAGHQRREAWVAQGILEDGIDSDRVSHAVGLASWEGITIWTCDPG